MTIELNIDRLDPHVPRGAPEAHAQDSTLYGAISGEVTVGRYVLQLGDPSGASIRQAAPSERGRFRPRQTPILLRPRLIRGLFGRKTELAAILSALDAGLPVEVTGEAGVGKTALLRHLAHHPRADAYVDGIVYIPARHQLPADLLQRIFEAFYESDEICRPTEAEIRRALQDTEALILLDGVELPRHELEHVLDIAPRSAFVVATRERRLWGEVRSLALKGLSGGDSVSLMEREVEHSLHAAERSAAALLSAALGGHPLRILQTAAHAREQGISLETLARSLTPATLVGELIGSIGEKPRRALLSLMALAGVPLPVQHVSGIAELVDVEPALMPLVRRGLVMNSQSRHSLADGVADHLRRTDDPNPWTNRAITYFTAWAERHRRNAGTLLEESEALLRVQQCALDARRWGEALRLGRLLEGALIVGARWGAWGLVLDRCLAAAKAIGDRSAESWALHEIGTRAICLGDPARARAALGQAAKLREANGDTTGDALTRRNLELVITPVSEVPDDETDDVQEFDAFPLRNDDPPAVPMTRRTGMTNLALAALPLAVLAGLVYWVDTAPERSPVPPRGPAPAAARGITRTPVKIEEPPALPLTAATEVAIDVPAPAAAASTAPAPAPGRASILIFTPRPGSIVTSGTTSLCYAINDAVRARVEPDVGDVTPASTLTCVRVAPVRTTTYELTASGRDGHPVRQQLVIVVR